MATTGRPWVSIRIRQPGRARLRGRYTVASHKLNIISTVRLVKQKVRRFHPDRHQIIQMEVDNLLRVGFIR